MFRPFLDSGGRELADWLADDFNRWIEKGKEILEQGYILDGRIENRNE